MKTKTLITMLVLLNTATIFAQQNQIDKAVKANRIQHSVFLELPSGVRGTEYAITYDCSFQLARKHKVTAGLGFFYLPPYEITRRRGNVTHTTTKLFHSMSIIPQINYLYGTKHHLELGIGMEITFQYWANSYHNSGMWTIPFARIGYRYQRSNGGFFGRAGVVVNMRRMGALYPLPFTPGVNLAVGYTFRNRR